MADKNKNNYIWIGIAIVAVIVLAIVFIFTQNQSAPKITKNDLTYSHLKINSFEVLGDGFCYKGGDGCYKTGCDYCDAHPDDCRVIMNYKVGIILPTGNDYLNCKRNVYIDDSLYDALSDTFQASETDAVSNTYPYDIGSIPHSKVKFELCCNNGGADICVSEEKPPIC